MIKKHKKQSGFTLVELVLTIALTIILGTAVVLFANDIFKAKAKAIAVTEVQQNMRFAMNKMSYYVRNSDEGINTASSTFAPTDPGSLYLNMSAGATDDVVFSLSSGRLQIAIGAGSPEFLTTNEVELTSLVFTNNSTDTDIQNVSIDLSGRYRNTSDRQEFNYTYSIQNSVSTRQ